MAADGDATAPAKPLLSPRSTSPAPAVAPTAAAQETLEELDRKYAPYARRDAYGPMGRGPLGPAEAARLAVAAALLLPLRVVAAALLLVAYYLVCRVCTLGVEEERQGAEGPGDGYARLRGWRRDAVVRCGRALARAMLFVFGFYRIRVDDRRVAAAQDEDLGKSEYLGRPGAIVSNHVSHLDILYHMSSSLPSFVAKRSVARLPLVGLISKCMGCIFVQRESKASDFKGVSGAVTERIERAHRQKDSPMMLLFPEGTTTNGDYLLPFKTGAFLAKAPVRPVILRYPYKRFSPEWDSMDGARHILLLLCQFANYLEVVHLPVYYPSEQEKDDPKLYASDVRKLMAVEKEHTVDDKDKEHTVYFPKRIDKVCGVNTISNVRTIKVGVIDCSIYEPKEGYQNIMIGSISIQYKKRKMDNHTFGEMFEGETTSTGRPSRAATRIRRSYNEDVIAPSFEVEEDNGVSNASSFPCYDFLRNAGLLDDFLFLINNVSLSTYMEDERSQYYMLTKIFVESFQFNNTHFQPSVTFRIYDRPITMKLKDFVLH